MDAVFWVYIAANKTGSTLYTGMTKRFGSSNVATPKQNKFQVIHRSVQRSAIGLVRELSFSDGSDRRGKADQGIKPSEKSGDDSFSESCLAGFV